MRKASIPVRSLHKMAWLSGSLRDSSSRRTYPRVKEKTEVGRVNVAVEAHNVEIDGLSIRYLTAGAGPPMVLLHGAGDNSSTGGGSCPPWRPPTGSTPRT